MMLMLLNGTYWHEAVTEKPVLGSTEIWEFVNLTEDTHPIHLHLVRFQVLNRQRFDVDTYLNEGKLRLDGDPLPRSTTSTAGKIPSRPTPASLPGSSSRLRVTPAAMSGTATCSSMPRMR